MESSSERVLISSAPAPPRPVRNSLLSHAISHLLGQVNIVQVNDRRDNLFRLSVLSTGQQITVWAKDTGEASPSEWLLVNG
jgi:bifunctional DNase/RNase